MSTDVARFNSDDDDNVTQVSAVSEAAKVPAKKKFESSTRKRDSIHILSCIRLNGGGCPVAGSRLLHAGAERRAAAEAMSEYGELPEGGAALHPEAHGKDIDKIVLLKGHILDLNWKN